jgi:hypothetical protein
MLVMGVATWMFPRPGRDDVRYRPELAEAVYWIMTLATALRAAAELSAPYWPAPPPRLAIALGGLGQLAGAALFVANMWSRVRMPSLR